MRLSILAMLVVAQAALADVPPRVGYQGRLLNADAARRRAPRSSSQHLDAASGGTLLFSEDQTLALSTASTPRTSATRTDAGIPKGVLDGNERWLEVVIGGETLKPRQPIDSVPYALVSNDAKNLVGGTVNASSISVNGTPVIDSSGKLTGGANPLPVTCQNSDVPRWNGTTWACGQAGQSNYSYDPNGGLTLTGASLNQFSLLQSCTAGQELQWNGTRWAWRQPARVRGGHRLRLTRSPGTNLLEQRSHRPHRRRRRHGERRERQRDAGHGGRRRPVR